MNADEDQFIYTSIKDGAFLSPVLRKRMKDFEERAVRCEVILREQRFYASDAQRRYYFRNVVRTFGDHFRSLGQEDPAGGPLLDETVHWMLKERFLKKSIPIAGSTEYITKVGSTRRLTRHEMRDYINNCIAYGTMEWFLRFPERDYSYSNKEGSG